jgi:hypothetical protein
MVVKVIDASAVAALLFGETEADAVAALCAGARLVAPSLLSYGDRKVDVARIE